MKQATRFLLLALRLTFLPLFEKSNKKKWTAAFLMAIYLVLMYAIFTASIQPKDRFRTVTDSLGRDASTISAEERRLYSIIFENARRRPMITIEPTKEAEARRKQDSANAANTTLTLDDIEFLVDVARGK